MPTRVFRNVHISSLVEEAGVDVSNFMFEAVQKNQDIATKIQKYNLQGMRTTANKFFEYGRDEYEYGLPALRLPVVIEANQEVIDVIEGIEGEPITVSTYAYGTPDEDFFAEETMVRLYAYDVDTDVVASPPFTPSAGSVVSYSDSDFGTGDIEIIYQETHTDTSVTTTMVATPLTDFGYFRNYFMVRYVLDSDVTTTKYFIYTPLTGTYPSLDEVDVPVDTGEYYPVIVMRENKYNYTEADGSKHATGVAALDILGIEFDSLLEQVSDNPDIDAIEDVSVQFFADIEAEDDATNLYLWEYFKSLDSIPQSTFQSQGSTYYTGMSIQLTNPNFYYTHSIGLIEEEILTGTIPTTKTLIPNTSLTTGPKYENRTYNNVSLIILYKQLTATTYSKLTVANFVMQYLAGADFVSANRNRAVGGGVDDIGTEFYRPMHVPINRTTLRRFSNNPSSQNEVLQRGLSLVINTRSIADIEWYETNTFISFVVALSWVIAVVTLQPELVAIGAATSLLLAAALTLALVLDIYIMGLIIEFALNFLVDTFGLEDTFFAILVVVVVAIATKTTNMLDLSSIAWADKLLAASMAFLSEFGVHINDAIELLMDESDAFLQSAEERQEEIDEANSLLGSSGIDPLSIVRTEHYFNPNESPNQFYNRTIHNGNPGVISLDIIESYVTNSLMLPKANDPNNLL